MTTRNTPPANGVPTWIDYMARDAVTTGKFFTDVFGWDVPPGDPEFGGYTTAALRGKSVSGIGPAWDETMPDVQSVYLATDNIEATVTKAKELGAQVMEFGEDGTGPDNTVMVVGFHGSMATFVDPTGATVGLWQANAMTGFGITDETGTPCWFELVTRDPETAKRFYGELFGFTFEGGPDETSGVEYYEAKKNGESAFGLMRTPDDVPAHVPAYWIGYYQTDDIDETAKKLVRVGGTIIAGPDDIDEGQWLNATTPGGAAFGVFAPIKRLDDTRSTQPATTTVEEPVGV